MRMFISKGHSRPLPISVILWYYSLPEMKLELMFDAVFSLLSFVSIDFALEFVKGEWIKHCTTFLLYLPM